MTTPTTAHGADTCRAAFEAEAPKHNITIERFKQRPDNYKFEYTISMYKLWQAAWSAALASPVGADVAIAAVAAGAPAQQSQPVAARELTDDQIYGFWTFRDCMDAIRAGDMRGQFISAVRAIERHLSGDTPARKDA